MLLPEVGTALPLNGGTYNCLLNSSSKLIAIIAGNCSLLSYVATAVVSAATAAAYLNGELGAANIFIVTIGVLAAFALLNLLGIRDSSIVAFVIFSIHIITLCIVIVACIITTVSNGGQILKENWSSEWSENPVQKIFFGFCVGLLGITGFETSANYIEDQKPGVFPKTMRNMWYLATFFNPTVSFLSLCVLGIQDFIDSPNNALSLVAGAASGRWLRLLVAIDAFIVLCGGVLTAFVGLNQ